GIRDFHVTGVQTCALPIYAASIEELYPLLVQKRLCKRITLSRHSLVHYRGEDLNEIINNFMRSVMELPKTWQGIDWREYKTMTRSEERRVGKECRYQRKTE